MFQTMHNLRFIDIFAGYSGHYADGSLLNIQSFVTDSASINEQQQWIFNRYLSHSGGQSLPSNTTYFNSVQK